MRLLKPLALATTVGICALTGGGDANGSTGFTLPTSLAAMRQDATAVCDRIPGEAGQAGLPGLAALSNGCYNAVAFVNARLDAGLGDGGSALIVPDDGGPILLRVATMTEGIGARVRGVR
ncbi:hypothetical protein [Burkholderia cepacia]|uniref:hypothetical protein n=1 Tax=Burkholderia cepacia TaxID=292 RepID=UPI003EE0F33D